MKNITDLNENNLFEKSLNVINDFCLIQPQDKDCSRKIFNTLNKIIPFKSAYVFYINPENIKLKYSKNSKFFKTEFKIKDDLREELFKGIFSEKLTNLLNFENKILIEKLTIKKAVFGFILIELKDFYPEYLTIFKTCALVISNIAKDIEVSKIITMQVEALQDGISDIQNKNSEILEANKAKNDFLAHISHELRTPLNSIIGFSELLTNEFIGELNIKQKEYVNDIQVSSLHLLGMINEVLDISKIEANAMSLNLRNFNIERAINEVCNILKPIAIKKEIEITTDIEEFDIQADYQKIQQILFNLVNNAIKFTPKCGDVTISAKSCNNEAILTIEDNGIGIEKKYHQKIFEKFEQINNSQVCNESSTGLGLTITQELVNLHKGTINVKSEVKKGSQFMVKIPL